MLSEDLRMVAVAFGHELARMPGDSVSDSPGMVLSRVMGEIARQSGDYTEFLNIILETGK